jgi:predicted RNA-binding Zn-ribbon protein involved in translation (DUF1610 family)
MPSILSATIIFTRFDVSSMVRINKKEKKKELCFCEKGVFPNRDPRAEYRCPQCGRLIWPNMGGQSR